MPDPPFEIVGGGVETDHGIMNSTNAVFQAKDDWRAPLAGDRDKVADCKTQLLFRPFDKSCSSKCLTLDANGVMRCAAMRPPPALGQCPSSLTLCRARSQNVWVQIDHPSTYVNRMDIMKLARRAEMSGLQEVGMPDHDISAAPPWRRRQNP